MAKRYFVLLAIAAAVIALAVGGTRNLHAQQDGTRFRISVDLVQLNVAVTDNKGNYVTGLKPTDFVISEDGIPEKLATFEEGNGPTVRLQGVAPSPQSPPVRCRRTIPLRAIPTRLSPKPSPAPTSSSSSTPATTCIAASSSPRTPSPTSSARSKPPTKSRSIPTAATSPAPRRSPPTARRSFAACAPPSPATTPLSTTRSCSP